MKLRVHSSSTCVRLQGIKFAVQRCTRGSCAPNGPNVRPLCLCRFLVIRLGGHQTPNPNRRIVRHSVAESRLRAEVILLLLTVFIQLVPGMQGGNMQGPTKPSHTDAKHSVNPKTLKPWRLQGLIITPTIFRVPYWNYSIMGPKTLNPKP